jgi:hypothetical protein
MVELRCFLSEDFLSVVILAVEVGIGRKLSSKEGKASYYILQTREEVRKL